MQKYVGVLEGMKPQFSRPQWPPPSLGQRTRQYCRRRRRFMFCHWSIPGQGWIIIAREPPPTQPSSRTLCVTEESWVIGRRRRRRGGLEGQVHPDRQTLFLSICQERRLFLLGTPLLRQLPSKLESKTKLYRECELALIRNWFAIALYTGAQTVG